MKLECPAKALAAAVKLCLPAVPTRTAKDVLRCVRIDAAPGNVTVSATDLELGVRASVLGAEVARPGVVVVPADRLAAILAEAPAGAVVIEDDAYGVAIKAGRGKHKLPAQPADEFPAVPAFDADRPHYAISGPVLASLVRRTVFAAHKRDATARWATCGVLVELQPDPPVVRLVATDTKRLATADASAEVREGDPAAAAQIVPIDAVRLLEQVASADTATVLVDVRKNEAIFRTGTATIWTRTVEGKFPPYRDILPKKAAPAALAFDPRDFLAGIRQAAVTADTEHKRVDFKFGPASSTFSAESPDGESVVEFPTPDYKGPAVGIALDANQIADILRVIDGEKAARLELVSDSKPAVFKAGDHFACLVMPLVG